jgi:hypothetical protein
MCRHLRYLTGLFDPRGKPFVVARSKDGLRSLGIWIRGDRGSYQGILGILAGESEMGYRKDGPYRHGIERMRRGGLVSR